jgi:hypothetical protein
MNSNQILEANQETHQFEVPNSFHELMCRPSAIMSFLFTFLQFLKNSNQIPSNCIEFQTLELP